MKLFQKNNESFVCYNCGEKVSRHINSSRDHCNHCLYGLHVDINPGDRANDCKGHLQPIGLKISNGKTQIAYQCQKCGKQVFCVRADDDNPEELVRLSSQIWQSN